MLAFSRWRFVAFATNETATTTMTFIAQALEQIGGVPKRVLADRMGCLKGGVVANVMIPTPQYVRFAAHYGFAPDFCHASDPESKGIVETLCGFHKDREFTCLTPWLLDEVLTSRPDSRSDW